ASVVGWRSGGEGVSWSFQGSGLRATSSSCRVRISRTAISGLRPVRSFAWERSEGRAAIPLSPRDRLGPYEIVAHIGSGGMGEVYRAFDARLHRDVALKHIHPALALTPEHVDRFSREARAAGSLNHPNIVVVYDVGVEGGIPYV